MTISKIQFKEFLENLERIEKEYTFRFDVKYVTMSSVGDRRIEINGGNFEIYFDIHGEAQNKKTFDFDKTCFVKVYFKNVCIQDFTLLDTNLLKYWWVERINNKQQLIIDEGMRIFKFKPMEEIYLNLTL